MLSFSSSSLLRPSLHFHASSNESVARSISSSHRKVFCCSTATKFDSLSKSGGGLREPEIEIDSDVLIECRDVYKSFGDKHILKGISFKIRHGEAVGVIGPSGTGKSTILKIMAGLLAPDQGEVYIRGKKRAGLISDEEISGLRIGLVFQSAALFDSLTVRENVGFLLSRTGPGRKQRNRLCSVFGSLTDEEESKGSLEGQVGCVDIKLPRRSLLVEFSCNSCGERTKRLINRLAYERGLGLVFVQDPSESSPTEVPTDQNVTLGEGRSYQARVPEMDAEQKPLKFPARSLRSPVVKKPSQSLPIMIPGSSSLREQVEQQQPPSAKSQEETGSSSAGSRLIQRKLQRNKQVVRDSLEWEEAYRVEAERRTVDEIFMREALVEAKKAADMWEVPVGAVLVHEGKIIARGYNLVEDLRDSTAHAEMICIREGSKVLRSWRLADTTLYVTLEPCPMCAGAILQARVNTLVWGAPNKLLGADGSWIRLFPGGEGNGSEVSEKPPPPVHPFHPKMTIRRGVLESECAQTMQQFFQLRRKKKDKNSEPPAPPTNHHHHHHPSRLLNKMHQILPFFCL